MHKHGERGSMMKKITMFMMESCPYCKKARRWMDELYAENAAYKTLEIEQIDEALRPDVAEKYDYFYVPTYYVGDEKVHEGAASLEIVRRVFDAALS